MSETINRYGVSQYGVAHVVDESGHTSRCGIPLRHVEPEPGDGRPDAPRTLAEYAESLRGRPPIATCQICEAL